MGSHTSTLIFTALTLAFAARAQDTRTVAEPKIPQSCTVLNAALAATENNKTLADSDEARLDTARIQKALDSCPQGQAVLLKAGDAHNAFLTGPLDLRPGVTLVIGAKTILFGSRDPKVYEVRPGSCGIVDSSGRGCRAMINGVSVTGAAVMGDGVIDGRGWSKMLGKTASWWEIAEEARKGGNQNCPRILVLNRCDDFTLYRVTLKNSANFHVAYSGGNGFTAWGVIIDTPKNCAQYRWHRSRLLHQRHHRPLLHQNRRRQCRHQGRRPRLPHDHRPQPLLHRPRHVHRQRN